MVSKIKTSLAAGLALAVALALIVAPLIMVQKVHAYAPVQAPDFYMTDLNNNTFSLSSLQPKVVLLNFFSPECSDCINEMSELQTVRAHFGSGLVMISDDADYSVSYSALKTVNDTYHINWTLTLDYVQAMWNTSMYNQPSINNGCGGTPQIYEINQTGYIIFAHCGYPTLGSTLIDEINSLIQVRAPDFSMRDLNGNTFNLSSFIAGKVALLEFFESTCGYCQNETGELDTVLNNYGNKITMLALSIDPGDWSSGNGTLVSFIQTYNVTYKIAEDTFKGTNQNGWNLYKAISGSGTVPQIFIINQTGNIEFYNLAAASKPAVPAAALIGEINSLMWDLNVTSAHDSPSPGVGDSFYPDGSSVTCNVTSPVTEGLTTWICTGYKGTGSVPAGASNPNASNNPVFGSSNMSVTFTITKNSSITWNWGSFLNVTVGTAYNMWTNGSFPNLVFLDLRNANEAPSNGAPGGYDNGHVYGALWIPWNGLPSVNQPNLTMRIGELAGLKNNDIILYCKGGVRSFAAAAFLVSQGFTRVYQMYQAFPGWYNAGYPSVNTTANLVVRGEDDGIYLQSRNSTNWQGWNALPGSTVDRPAAAVLWGNVTGGNETMYTVVQGSDGSSLWYGNVSINVKATNYNTFSGWTLMDGATPSAPTLASNGTVLCLVVRGEDNRIYCRVFSGGSWGSWFVVPTGATLDSPAAAMLGNNLHIVVRGMDGSSLWDIVVGCDGSVVRGWMLLSGATPSRPILASSQARNMTYLVVEGMDNHIWYMNYTGLTDSWGSWSALPSGATVDGPAAMEAGNLLYVAVRGMDGTSLWDGNINEGIGTFSGWTMPTGATPSPPTITG